MDIAVQGIVEHLDEMWTLVLDSVKDVDDTLFQWCVGPEYNSAAILLRHLAGSERWWIGEGIGGVPSHRKRDTEFVHDTPRRADVLASVADARALTHRVLADATAERLQAPTAPTVPGDGARPSQMWALLHYHEHLGYHRGQILLILKMGRHAPARR
jgi:uncharacterized damage-inducible protein DinB